MTNDPEVLAAAARYRLVLGRQRQRGRLGSRRGSGVGSSLEFLDYRDYVPGDDLRHLDWRGYARTEQLRIRLHQEEVAPYVDVLVDGSASLATTPAKELAARQLVALLRECGRREVAAVRCLQLGGGPTGAADPVFAAPATGPALPALPLRQGGVRVLVTDGLWEGDPGPFLHRLFAGASCCHCVQVLDPWELDPSADGALTLVDVEDGGRAEVQLGGRVLATYRERLQRLIDGLRRTVLGLGGSHALVPAAALATMCARDLLPAGVLEPA